MDSETKKHLSKLVADNLKYAVHLHKHISVTLAGGKSHTGWLKCVDPMSGTLILITLESKDGTYEVKDVVFIHNPYIIAVDVLLDVDPDVKSFLLKLYAPVVHAVDENRRDRLVSFIKAHRMPAEVSADGRDICINGCTIQPPYNAESCMGFNPNVVSSTGKVIEIFDERGMPTGTGIPKSNEESELQSGMEDLKLTPVEDKKDVLSDFDFSDGDFDSSSNDERGFAKKLQRPTSSGESSGTEESYEFVSKARF